MYSDEKPKLKALADIASIDITLEFNEILEKILETTCDTIGAHSGTMMLVDDETGKLDMVASYGLPENYIEMVYEAAEKAGVPLTSSPSGTVLKTGKYYIVPDVYEEPKDKPWLHLCDELGFSSQIFTPMKKGRKVIGLLNVYREKSQQFLDEEIDFITIAASQASSIVQNARMCIRMKKNMEELEDYKNHLEKKVRETNKQLYDSELYLRTIFDSSFDGIFVIDDKGRFEYGNKSCFNISGWQEDEFVGEFFMKVIPEDMHDFMLGKWNEIQNGIEIPYETKIKTKSGKIRNLFVSHSRTEMKGKTKYVIVIKDVTDFNKLLFELKESEKKYRELFENAHDTMYVHDGEGIILKMNDIGVKLMGCFSGDEVIGTHFSEWLTPESSEYARKTLVQHLSGQPVERPIVLEVVCRDGEHKWAEIINRPVIKDGKITEIHGIARDITEKKKLEQELLESYQKLKEADNLKTKFISNITHELMTPMTAIKGFTELVKDETLGKINEDQKKSLDAILRNSNRLINLIEQLLHVTHLENDLMELHKETYKQTVQINDIISRTVDDVRPMADAKQICIKTNTKPVPEITGVEEQLYEVIINLLGNALKFTPVKGIITINLSDYNEKINISITDDGIGIPPGELSSIFDRFYQVDGSTSRKYGGSGIGLSLCKSIIEKHKGLIWAESDGKKGSTFHIVLPVTEE
ncbi:MAG: PAS domain S-box protein [Candidatus Methanoperedens sp.]|nr:PAS domain S-box protein [Candidatus Methanoperedens sp.]